MTSGASDQRLKQARKEWIYVDSSEKAWAEKKISPTVSLHTGSTDHWRTQTFEGAAGERHRFDFWWVSFIEIQTEIQFKVLNVYVLFCWVCKATAAAMPWARTRLCCRLLRCALCCRTQSSTAVSHFNGQQSGSAESSQSSRHPDPHMLLRDRLGGSNGRVTTGDFPITQTKGVYAACGCQA